MIKLHYASIDSDKEINIFEFKDKRALLDQIDQICYGKLNENVLLFSTDNHSDFTFVTNNYLEIQFILSKCNAIFTSNDYYLQEYDSFEEAYSIALSMKESNEKCYSK